MSTHRSLFGNLQSVRESVQLPFQSCAFGGCSCHQVRVSANLSFVPGGGTGGCRREWGCTVLTRAHVPSRMADALGRGSHRTVLC